MSNQLHFILKQRAEDVKKQPLPKPLFTLRHHQEESEETENEFGVSDNHPTEPTGKLLAAPHTADACDSHDIDHDNLGPTSNAVHSHPHTHTYTHIHTSYLLFPISSLSSLSSPLSPLLSSPLLSSSQSSFNSRK